MNQINSTIRATLLNRFVEHWNGWTYESKPTCFWVREYELGQAKRKHPNFHLMWPIGEVAWARNAWLLDAEGLHERSPLDWQRFQLLRESLRSESPTPTNEPIHEIGMGCFAPLGDSQFFCEEIWGRRWGHGIVLTPDEGGNRLSESMEWMI